MNKWYHHKFINIIIVIVSFLFSLFFIELALSKLNIPPKVPLRYLFISKPNLKDQKTSFGFHPNIMVREVSVFEVNREFHIEYDYFFQTNNLGLVQKMSVVPHRKSIIFIGNSFTQGQGAVPWFYKLEEYCQNKEYQLVNLGIMGTGVQQWNDTLKWFNNIAKARHIFILFLSGDWLRGRWYAEGNSGLYFIPPIEDNQIQRRNKSTFIYFIDKHMDHKALLCKAKQLKLASKGVPDEGSFERLYIFRAIGRMRVWVGKKRREIVGVNEIEISDKDLYEMNRSKKSFNQIISYYGIENITTIHLPTKKEVIQGEYDRYGNYVKEYIISRNVSYVDGLNLCGLTPEDYHEYDGHPNTDGYTKIRKLVENMVKNQITK